MSNVLDHEKQQQIVALGRLGWSLRRIEQTTGVRRETISTYLKSAAIPIRGHGQRPRVWAPGKTGHSRGGVHRSGSHKPLRIGPGQRSSR